MAASQFACRPRLGGAYKRNKTIDAFLSCCCWCCCSLGANANLFPFMEWMEHGKVHYLEYNKRGKIVFHRFLFFSFTFIATPDGDGDAVLLLLMRRDASDVHSLDVYTTHTLHNIASFCFKWSLCPATHNRRAADGRAETRDVEGGRKQAKGRRKGEIPLRNILCNVSCWKETSKDIFVTVLEINR